MRNDPNFRKNSVSADQIRQRHGGIFVGMYAWRDYLIPSLFATDPNARTLVVGIYNFTGSYFNNWPVIFAAIVIQSIPLVVLFLVFQKSFVDGITSGAVKG